MPKYEAAFSHLPLNQALLKLKERYNWQYSFDDRLLSQFNTSLTGTFTSKEALMDALLKDLPLTYELNNDVLILYRLTPKPIPWLITGRIMEAGTHELLPFSHVTINGQGSTTDFRGTFSHSTLTDSVFRVIISHLGCYRLDTILYPGIDQTILLHPAIVGLPEIVVNDRRIEKSAQIGALPGLLTINPYIAQYLPGNGDNSVFNLLRLQPGILAAGEQTNDLIIWGCSEGTSRLKMDGFSIWKLNNLSDQIGAINPYLLKNIRVMKGGYDASIDDVTGGIADITAINGNTRNIGFNLFVNNQTINGMAEIPIMEKSSLVMAFRQTYQNLFSASNFKSNRLLNPDSGNQSYTISPNYVFRDLNLKYSVPFNNGGLFYLSALASNDHLHYRYKQEWPLFKLFSNNHETNTQLATSVHYGKNGKNGNRTDFKSAYSVLAGSINRERFIERNRNNKRVNRVDAHAEQSVAEWTGEVEHQVQIGNRHQMGIGTELIANNVTIHEDTFNVESAYWKQQAMRLAVFLQDEISLTPQTKFKAGLRFNYSFELKRSYFDPRLSIQTQVADNWKINLAWGIYHQFLMKSSVIDEDENYHYIWAVANNTTIPVLKAVHYVGGIVFSKANTTVSCEPYYKENHSVTQFFRMNRQEFMLKGKSRAYGIDLFVKQDIGQHALWIAYSLGKTEEFFYKVMDNDFLTGYLQHRYRRAPQDQRHEIKMAGVLNFRNWHFSTTFIHGSGFPFYTNYRKNIYTEPDYNRLDAAITYKRTIRRVAGEVGFSILNLLDAENVKYASFVKVPLDQLNTVYVNTEPVEFTPLLYLKLSY